jgi:hypothetical protein
VEPKILAANKGNYLDLTQRIEPFPELQNLLRSRDRKVLGTNDDLFFIRIFNFSGGFRHAAKFGHEPWVAVQLEGKIMMVMCSSACLGIENAAQF